MSGPSRRFDPSELRTPGEAEPPVAELADALATARELEALAASDGIRPIEGFEDRVMAAIAAEPVLRVVVRSGSAVRGGRPVALLLAVRDAWRVATTGGRPMGVRAQALAFVLIVVVGAGVLTTATAITVGGFLQRNDSPTPSVEPGPSVIPTPTGPAPTVTPGPSETPEATETAEPTETAEAAETPKPGETPRPTRTPRPTETPKPGETPEPTDTPEPSDDHGGSGPG